MKLVYQFTDNNASLFRAIFAFDTYYACNYEY